MLVTSQREIGQLLRGYFRLVGGASSDAAGPLVEAFCEGFETCGGDAVVEVLSANAPLEKWSAADRVARYVVALCDASSSLRAVDDALQALENSGRSADELGFALCDVGQEGLTSLTLVVFYSSPPGCGSIDDRGPPAHEDDEIEADIAEIEREVEESDRRLKKKWPEIFDR